MAEQIPHGECGVLTLETRAEVCWSWTRVPTVVNFTTVMLARIVWYGAEEREIKRGDDADARHYATACYADIPRHRRRGPIVGLLPAPGVRLMTLERFARDYLS
jgi:hypothetical protein